MGQVAVAPKRSYQRCLMLSPNTSETIERMTCHCFPRPIRRDLTSSSYTTDVFMSGADLLACLLAYFERARTPLTSFIHSFRFSMMFFSSAMLKPVSFCSWSTYVNAGLPLFLAPCFGSQSSRSLITSSFFLQQCPINRSLLIISVSIILGRLPYSSLLVLGRFN